MENNTIYIFLLKFMGTTTAILGFILGIVVGDGMLLFLWVSAFASALIFFSLAKIIDNQNQSLEENYYTHRKTRELLREVIMEQNNKNLQFNQKIIECLEMNKKDKIDEL